MRRSSASWGGKKPRTIDLNDVRADIEEATGGDGYYIHTGEISAFAAVFSGAVQAAAKEVEIEIDLDDLISPVNRAFEAMCLDAIEQALDDAGYDSDGDRNDGEADPDEEDEDEEDEDDDASEASPA